MEKLIDVISSYLKSDFQVHNALMLNGEWGSGKTYFVRKILKKKIKEYIDKDYEIIHISLCGIDDISQLSEQIFYKILIFKNEKIEKSVFGKFLKLGKEFIPDKYKDSIYKNFKPDDWIKIDKVLYIFDDLERISPKLNIVDVLGFINSTLIETDNPQKVLIISNEKEIDNDVKGKYELIKEKVIGRTLSFKPDIPKIIRVYFDNMINSNYKTFLKNHSDFIIEAIDTTEIVNLRTLFFFFDNLKSIISEIDIINEIDIKYIEGLGKKIIATTLVYSIEYKGNKNRFNELGNIISYYHSNSLRIYLFDGSDTIKNELDDLKREFQKKYPPLTNYILYLNPIYNYIEHGYLDVTKLKESLDYLLPKSESPEVEAISILDKPNLRLIDDNTFISSVNCVIKTIEKAEYNVSNFIYAVENLNTLIKEGVIDIGKFIESEFEDYLIKHFKEIVNIEDSSDYIYLMPPLDDYITNMEDTLPKLVKEINDSINSSNKSVLDKNRNWQFERFKENPTSFLFDLNKSNDVYNNLVTFLILLHNEEINTIISEEIEKDSKILVGLNGCISRFYKKQYFYEPYFRERKPNKEKEILEEIKTSLEGIKNNMKINKKPLTNYRLITLIAVIEESINELSQQLDRKENE